MAHQRLATPVAGYVTEEAMFNFVPFTGPRWKMAHFQLEAQLIRQILQSHLPQAAAVIVAATSVGCDHQFAGARKALLAHFFPPTANAVGREISRVMIDADADPTLIVSHVV